MKGHYEDMIDTDARRWAAVTGKDERANGQFVYSVASTGVYCRPSCPARPALRQNVRFHETCVDAERAGFRACKRCRPDEASLSERHAEAVQRACRIIETAEAVPALNGLALAAGLSRFHFLRVFRKITGVTPGQYAAKHRAERVRSELRGGASITSAIYDAGFNSSSRFYEKAPEMLGMKPGQFRDGGAGVAIRYAFGHSSLGLVMIAATDLGICSVRFGETETALLEELRENFPLATMAEAGAEFEARARAVIEHIDDPRTIFDLPLDIRGTAFQMRVWRALREIPVGKTATYSEVAARAGNPAAVRAAGTACGANPVAVLVPCHRAVRADGGSGGYRWGLERKRKLIEREAARKA